MYLGVGGRGEVWKQRWCQETLELIRVKGDKGTDFGRKER